MSTKHTPDFKIEKSLDPAWPKFGVITKLRATEWFDTHAEALAYARGLDIGSCAVNTHAELAELVEVCKVLLAVLPHGNEALQIKAQSLLAKAQVTS